MALELEEDYKGMTCKYWKIIVNEEDYKTGKTKSIMGLYVDAAQRETGVANFLKREVKTFDVVDQTREQVYALWKTSAIIVDEEGNETESNKFANATDC